MAHPPNLEPIQVLSLLLQDAEAKCDDELGLSHLLNASRDTFLRHHVRPDSYYAYYRFLLSMQNDPEPNWWRKLARLKISMAEDPDFDFGGEEPMADGLDLTDLTTEGARIVVQSPETHFPGGTHGDHRAGQTPPAARFERMAPDGPGLGAGPGRGAELDSSVLSSVGPIAHEWPTPGGDSSASDEVGRTRWSTLARTPRPPEVSLAVRYDSSASDAGTEPDFEQPAMGQERGDGGLALALQFWSRTLMTKCFIAWMYLNNKTKFMEARRLRSDQAMRVKAATWWAQTHAKKHFLAWQDLCTLAVTPAHVFKLMSIVQCAALALPRSALFVWRPALLRGTAHLDRAHGVRALCHRHRQRHRQPQP